MSEDMFWTPLLFGIVAGLAIAMLIFLFGYSGSGQVYGEIILIDSQLAEISDTYYDAEENYQLATYAYADSSYQKVITYCEFARDDYSIYAQELRNIKFSIDSTDTLLDFRRDMISEQVVMAESMYEACEYFESAARYYDKYFSMDFYIGEDLDYEMAGQEMDSMNEKILQHDEAVRRYNDLLAEYTYELNKRLGK